ncbi:MAG TPA: ComEC/Rec2 family competence protein, partial [Bacteroidia bacterium]
MQTYLTKTPFLRFLMPFVAGIVVCIVFKLNIEIHWTLLTAFAALSTACYLLLRKRKIQVLFGLMLNVFFFACGIETCYLYRVTNHPDHYSHFIKNHEQKYIAYICNIPQEKAKSVKCNVHILEQEKDGKFKNASGELIVYLEKGNRALPSYGDKLIFTGLPKLISEPNNPFEFNYKQYLAYKNIFHQVYLKDEDYIIDGKYKSNALFDFAIGLKTNLLNTLKENGLSGNEYAVTAALMLGYDDEISSDLMTAYSHTGTLHVLSVSGLHVGVLFLALNFLIRLPKRRAFDILKTVIILCCLWFYALLSGLSPSVIRSTAMFSFVLFGVIFNKKGQIYNSIFASAFIMLLFDPFLVIDSGFQLSYLAVIGIVFLFPYIYKWYIPRRKWDDLIWKMFAVSLSAQIITLPITLYYFHQFPVLFFIANMLVIPLSYVVMFGSVFIVLFSKVKVIAMIITWIVSKSVWIMNTFTEWLDQLEFSYISDINTGFIDMIILFFLLITITNAFLRKSPLSLMASLCIITFILISGLVFKLEGNPSQLVVFHFNKESTIGIIGNKSATYLNDSIRTDNSRSLQTIASFNTISGIQKLKSIVMKPGVYQFTYVDKKWSWLNGCDLSSY